MNIINKSCFSLNIRLGDPSDIADKGNSGRQIPIADKVTRYLELFKSFEKFRILQVIINIHP